MSATKDWMLEITRAIEAAETAITEAADCLRIVNDLVYDEDANPMVRLSYDEIDCLTQARKWLDAEFSTVQGARECKVW